MNRKLLVLLPLLTVITLRLFAQVPPACPTPPAPNGTTACTNTCVYCDFDGFGGINNGAPSGGASGCPGIQLHNDRWYAFIAGSETIGIELIVNNCNTPDGLQAAFYDACNADAIVCNGGAPMGAANPPQILPLTYNDFVPGQIYYLMIDGYNQSICDFVINVTQGSVEAPAPGNASTPMGPTEVCPGATAVYTIPDVFGAGFYNWTVPAGSTINGGAATASIPAPEGTSITVTWGPTAGNVCVRAGNPCYPTTQQFCLPVMNKKIPDTNKNQVVVCNNELPYIWDEDPNQIIQQPTLPGGTTLSVTLQSWLGCDSIVKQKIIAKSPIVTNIATPFYICEGECFTMGLTTTCTSANNLTEKLESFQGCDSLVNYNVFQIPSNAVIPTPGQITCTAPSLTLNSTGSTTLTGNVNYTWTNATWNNIGNNVTQGVSAAGVYHLIVSNQGSTKICKDTATVTVTANVSPPGATASSSGSINCNTTSSNLSGSSGTNGVNYQWSGPGINAGNQFQQNPTVSAGGTYTLVVTNPANSCTSAATVNVAADTLTPTANVSSNSITCVTPNSTLSVTTNATTPTFQWAGPGINAGNQNQQSPVVTVGGTYTVTVTSSTNGCKTNSATTVVQNNTIPTVSAGQDQTITCAVPNITLNGSGSIANATPTFTWTGPGINAGNQNQQSPSINVDGTYILTVSNASSGCAKSDTVVIGSSVTAPPVTAGTDQTLTCGTTTVTLSAVGSAQGANITLLWSGPGITPANQNQYQPVVNQPGTYTALVTNTASGCTATDVVVVNLNNTAPTANAGTPQQLTCLTPNGVALNGSGSPAGISYLWTGPGVGINNETQQNPVVTVAGTYTLQVTDPGNGCTSTSQVTVTQDPSVPVANAGTDLKLNCTVSSVNINAGASSSGSNIAYNWSGPGINAGNQTVQSPSNLTAPGTYNLSVTNTTNNCVTTDILVIEIDTIKPTASAGADLVLNCFNSVTDTLNATASSTGTNFTYLWTGPGITPANQNSANPILSGVSGTYTLLVTNTDNTCTSTDQAVATINTTPPDAVAGTDKTIDCVVTSVQIGGASSSGPAFTYLWTGPAITPANATQATPTVDEAGTYQLVVNSSANGCTASSTTQVISDAVYPNAVAGADGLLTCAAPDATLNGSASSNGAGYAITWTGPGINAGNQSEVSPLVSVQGTYIIEVRNTTNSCVSVDTVFVDEDKAAPTASAGEDLFLDCQTPSNAIDGSASSAGNDFLYLWSGPGITPANETEVSPTVADAGTYTLFITNLVNGCTATDQVVVDKDVNLPTANAGAPITLTCKDNALPLDGSLSSTGATISYAWNGPGINTTNFDDVNPVVAEDGTYTLLITNSANNCTATATVLVSEDKVLPITSAGVGKVLTCANLSVNLDGTLSASGTNISYAWDGPSIVTGALSNQPTVDVQGTYTLTVTNSENGCTNSAVVMVTEDKVLPGVEAGPESVITCANSASGVTLNSTGSSSGANFTYLWTGPGITPANQAQPNPTVLVPGDYQLQITNTANGCINTDDVTIAQDQNIPTALAGTDQVISCAVTNVTLDGSNSTTPSGSLNFAWTGPGITPVTQNDEKPVVNQSGSYTLTVTNPQTGCSASDQVSVNLDTAPPVLTTTGGEITCQTQNVNVTVSSTPAATTYSWTGPAIGVGQGATASVNVDLGGIYFVTVTGPNGCTAEAQAVVTVDANVPDGTKEDGILNCANGGETSISGQILNPPNATFTWTGPGGFTSNDAAPVVTTPGTYNFIISTPTGCTRTIEVQVTEDYDKPTVKIANPEMIDCNTSEIVLNAAGTSTGPNFSYTWTSDVNGIISGGNGLNPLVNKAGAYTILVTNALNGCVDSLTTDVEVDPQVPTGFDVAVKDIRCFGESNGSISVNDVVNGTPPFAFSLSGTSGVTSNQFTGLKAGSYLLAVVDGNGCKYSELVDISEPGELIVSLGNDITVHLGEEATVSATIQSDSAAIRALFWNTSYAQCDSTGGVCDTTFTYKPLETYLHKITVTDENGCVRSDEVTVIVKRDRLVYVPNVFNPDSDDPNNAVLTIFAGIDVVKIKKWLIFDRWGSAVFEVDERQPNDPGMFWDGNVRGKKGGSAVYVWYAEIEFLDGRTETFEGDVTLKR
jgi:hypothetical protein